MVRRFADQLSLHIISIAYSSYFHLPRYFQACLVLRYRLAGCFGRGDLLAPPHSGGSVISSTGVCFIGCDVVVVTVAVVSIGRGGELLATYECSLVCGAASYHRCSRCSSAVLWQSGVLLSTAYLVGVRGCCWSTIDLGGVAQRLFERDRGAGEFFEWGSSWQ